MEGGAPASIKMIYIYSGRFSKPVFRASAGLPVTRRRLANHGWNSRDWGEVKKVLMASLIPGNRSGEWSTNFHLFADITLAPSPVCLDSPDARNHRRRSFEGSIKN